MSDEFEPADIEATNTFHVEEDMLDWLAESVEGDKYLSVEILEIEVGDRTLVITAENGSVDVDTS